MNKNREKTRENEKFSGHESVFDKVRSWPKWKRNLIGAATPEDLEKELEMIRNKISQAAQ